MTAPRSVWELFAESGEAPRSTGSPRAATPPSLADLPNEDLAPVLAVIRRVSEAILRPAEASRLFLTIAEEASTLLAPSSAVVCTLEPGGSVLRVHLGTGPLARFEGELLPVEGSLEGRAVLTGELQRTTDLAADPRAYRAGARELPAAPAAAVALQVGDLPVGALLLARAPGEPAFENRELSRLLLVTDVAAAAIENLRRYDRGRESRATLEAWRRERELQSWIARYSAVVQDAGMVVFQWDPATGALTWGDSLHTVLGYQPDDFADSSDHLLGWVHPEDWEAVERGLEAAREDTRFRLSLRLRHRGGHYRRVAMYGRRVSVAPGEGPVLVGVVEDLAMKEVRTGKPQKKVSDVGTKRIIRALRHEMNNPLAAILGQAQLLEREEVVQGDPTLQNAVGAISDEGKRLLDLSRRLMAMEENGADPELDDSGRLLAGDD